MFPDQLSALTVYRLPSNPAKDHPTAANPQTLAVAAELLQRRFDALTASDPTFRRYLALIRESGLQIVVLGGWARDGLRELICGTPVVSRDIDLVAHGSASVTDVLASGGVRNAFGGVGLKADTIHLDVWNLRETFLIQRHSLPVAYETLPSTADFTFNALVFLPAEFFGRPSVIERGAIEAIQTRVVEFATQDIAMPVVQVARALILAVRMSYRLSDAVMAFITDICSDSASTEQVLRGIETYCPPHLKVAAHGLFVETLNRDPISTPSLQNSHTKTSLCPCELRTP
jgi:hypothetical protein